MGLGTQGAPCLVPAWAKAEVSFQMALVAVGSCRVTLVVGSAPCASAAPGPRAGAVPAVAGSVLARSRCFRNTWLLGSRGGCCACWQSDAGLGSPPQTGGQQPGLNISCRVSRTHSALSGGRARRPPHAGLLFNVALVPESRAAQPAVTQPRMDSSPAPLVPTDDIALQGLNEAGMQYDDTECAEDRSLSSTVN